MSKKALFRSEAIHHVPFERHNCQIRAVWCESSVFYGLWCAPPTMKTPAVLEDRAGVELGTLYKFRGELVLFNFRRAGSHSNLQKRIPALANLEG